jgi:hypothetical protein
LSIPKSCALGELIDIDKEIERLNKDLNKARQEVARCTNLLGNPGFTAMRPSSSSKRRRPTSRRTRAVQSNWRTHQELQVIKFSLDAKKNISRRTNKYCPFHDEIMRRGRFYMGRRIRSDIGKGRVANHVRGQPRIALALGGVSVVLVDGISA